MTSHFPCVAEKSLGIAGLVGAGRTEAVQCLFGVWPGRWQGEIFIDGQPVSISNCQQAIAHGIAMVPEDRKKRRHRAGDGGGQKTLPSRRSTSSPAQ